MFKKPLTVSLIIALVLMSNISLVMAEERDEEIAALKTQVQELLKRIEKLEQEQVKTKEDVKKVETAAAGRVDLANTLSKLKLKGRWAAGFYDSGKAGSFPSGSFEAPEAKIQFAFEPDEINKIIMRMNLNNFTFNNLDYFYLDTDLKKLLNVEFPLNSRLGRMKLDFGEETWSNNSVEGVLPSNSAGNVSGSDEGLQVSGKLGKVKPLSYTLSVTNGTSTSTGTSDTSSAKAFTGKLAYNIIDPLYASTSYYNSGSMKSSSAEMGIGGLTGRPGSALRWSREIWEVDLRYDFKKGKVLNPLAFSDSKAILRLAYGGFSDDASGAVERSGQYGFVEGTYNLTKEFYLASRLSLIDLDGDTNASLNTITANEYQRYSLGGGYRLTENTLLKLGYDLNEESGADTDDADNNLISAIVASQF